MRHSVDEPGWQALPSPVNRNDASAYSTNTVQFLTQAIGKNIFASGNQATRFHRK